MPKTNKNKCLNGKFHKMVAGRIINRNALYVFFRKSIGTLPEIDESVNDSGNLVEHDAVNLTQPSGETILVIPE